jgi:hypothetical protein
VGQIQIPLINVILMMPAKQEKNNEKKEENEEVRKQITCATIIRVSFSN